MPETKNRMRVMCILGSARAGGSTSRLLAEVIGSNEVQQVDLIEHTISHYGYGREETNDDFLGIIESMLDHDTIIYVTPVYWYAMSGRMKVFFDRFTELLSDRKDLGRSLKGKTTYLIASGSNVALPEGFEIPFRDTSQYFDMNYGGCFYGKVGKDGSFSYDLIRSAREFGERIFRGLNGRN